jgi:2-polyprenyl-3-methyl-5-hydroxy-6-metoxy-1,4-benzoquinol methylase
VIASRTAKGPVLDFGCGDGIATVAALARGAHVCAIDPDEGAIRRLLARVPSQQHRRLRARVGHVLDADFQGDHFEAVHAAYVLEEFDGPAVQSVLRQFSRWLVPGGRLFVSVLTRVLDEETLHRELEAAGFAIEEIHCYPLPWDNSQTCCAAIARCAS